MEDIAQWILLFGVLGFGTTTMFGMRGQSRKVYCEWLRDKFWAGFCNWGEKIGSFYWSK